MGKQRAERPWTWRQIAALKGTDLAAFLDAYGERGQMARVIARAQAPGGWLRCPLNREHPCPILSLQWMGADPVRERGLRCQERAVLIYARMIAELGLLPR